MTEIFKLNNTEKLTKCAFCQHPQQLDKFEIDYCPICVVNEGIHSVRTIYHNDKKLYTHVSLRTENYEVIRIPASDPIPGSGFHKIMLKDIYIEIGGTYNFRYEWENDYTILMFYRNDDYETIVTLPGQPITPANAKAKLQTILTFL